MALAQIDYDIVISFSFLKSQTILIENSCSLVSAWLVTEAVESRLSISKFCYWGCRIEIEISTKHCFDSLIFWEPLFLGIQTRNTGAVHIGLPGMSLPAWIYLSSSLLAISFITIPRSIPGIRVSTRPLQPLSLAESPWTDISMHFIVSVPVSRNCYDMVMTTCRFTKSGTFHPYSISIILILRKFFGGSLELPIFSGRQRRTRITIALSKRWGCMAFIAEHALEWHQGRKRWIWK